MLRPVSEILGSPAAASLNGRSDYLLEYINIKLTLLGCRPVQPAGGGALSGLLAPVVSQFRHQQRLLANHLCPVDHGPRHLGLRRRM